MREVKKGRFWFGKDSYTIGVYLCKDFVYDLEGDEVPEATIIMNRDYIDVYVIIDIH